MKKYFIYAVSALALAGCSSDDFLGGQPSPTKLTDNNVINFNGGSSATTRAPKEGSAAATALNNKFVVYGYKTSGSTSQVVYDHYNVIWDGKKNQTESNTEGWEYVGQEANDLNTNKSAGQTIKYWDYSADQYDFIAFSFGEAKQVTAAPANANEVQASSVDQTPKYTLKGTVENLAKVYIADRVTAKKDVSQPTPNPLANRLVSYGTSIPFNFRSLGTKVRIGLYEIIPGYSVKDVKFYKNNSEKNGNNGADPCLYASGTTIPAGSGTMTVSFPTVAEDNTDYNKAHVTWASTSNASVLGLTDYSLGSDNADKNEESGNYLVRTSTDARNATYNTVLPAPVGALKLKVDYTLVSIDGSKETINVKGATAVVPEVYTKWEPNYAYTYIFKISDNTNGSTGGGETGLYPITFDAIVTKTEDGLSETITTVSEPSITTYAKGAVNNEYEVNDYIYVKVEKSAGTDVTLNNTNCALYIAEGTNYIGGITEATVENCMNTTPTQATDEGGNWISSSWTVTDKDSNTLKVTTTSGLEIVSGIAAAHTPDGNAISGNFARFQPTTAGTYVFQYIEGDNKYYKVIKVN